MTLLEGDHSEAGVGADCRDNRSPVEPGSEEIVEDPEQCGFGIGLLRVPAAARS